MVIINNKEPLPTNAQFKTKTGENAKGQHAIFPICRYKDKTRNLISFVGTAFLIQNNGLFLTAKHVLEDSTGKYQPDLFGIYFHKNNTYYKRELYNVAIHPKADIAAGFLAPMSHKQNNTTLTNDILEHDFNFKHCGGMISTFAYPKTKESPYDNENFSKILFKTNWEFGNILETHPTGRDSVMLPGSCYRTDMKIEFGASGGPVADSRGIIIGVNSTGFDGTNDTYVSSIYSALELKFSNKYCKGKERNPQTSLNDLLKRTQ